MNAACVLNAGGAGTRMGGALPKPLVPVLGLPLIERNLLSALGTGARRIVVVAPAQPGPLTAWVSERAAPLCAGLGAALFLVVEPEPRGTGACMALAAAALAENAPDHAPDDPFLLLYADNLTALDLRALLAVHRERAADVTVAVHAEPFTLPYGRVRHAEGLLVAYDEKPVLPVPVASGVNVFSPQAVAAIGHLAEARPNRRLDVPELVRARLAAGRTVAVFEHEAPWIDVNEPAAVLRAEALIQRTPALEQVVERPDLEVCGIVLRCGDRVLLERRSDTARLGRGLYDTPGGKLHPGEPPAQALARELREELGLDGLEARPVCVFDEPDGALWVRHHVFAGAITSPDEVAAREGQSLSFVPLAGLAGLAGLAIPLASPARRSIAWVQAQEAPGGRP